MASLNLRNIVKRFGAFEVIKGVSLDVEHGEFVAFVGPSGCGKSTLLRMIAGLEAISGGDLLIGGKIVNDVKSKDRGIAMVFQSYALYPHKTVYENMAFGLRIAKVPQAQIDAKVKQAAAILHIDHLLDRKPAQLSGGQRQRVAIGRTIVRKPDVFLFDEPLSNLDAALRVNTRAELSKLHRDLDATMIYVTHDQVEAMTLADKIVVLDGGIVRQVGAPLELYNNPADTFVAGFLGSPRMNFATVTATAIDESGITVKSAGMPAVRLRVETTGARLGGDMTLGIRPHDLNLHTGGAIRIEGNVTLVERLGPETLIELVTDEGTTFTSVNGGTSSAQIGDRVALGFDDRSAHLFGTDGRAFRKTHPGPHPD